MAASDAVHNKTTGELISHNVETIRDLQEQVRVASLANQRFVTYVTKLIARPLAVYLVLAFVAVWTAANLLLKPAFDPSPFPILQGLLSLGGVITALMVLVAQRGHSRISEQRAHLELQINLLAEHKITKLIALVEELRDDFPEIPKRVDRVADTMKQPTSAHEIVSALADSHME